MIGSPGITLRETRPEPRRASRAGVVAAVLIVVTSPAASLVSRLSMDATTRPARSFLAWGRGLSTTAGSACITLRETLFDPRRVWRVGLWDSFLGALDSSWNRGAGRSSTIAAGAVLIVRARATRSGEVRVITRGGGAMAPCGTRAPVAPSGTILGGAGCTLSMTDTCSGDGASDSGVSGGEAQSKARTAPRCRRIEPAHAAAIPPTGLLSRGLADVGLSPLASAIRHH